MLAEINYRPDLVLVLSGKRKSGKDYFSARLDRFIESPNSDFSQRVVYQKIVLAAQLKRIYANEHSLDYDQLLDSSGYKETHRLGLIK